MKTSISAGEFPVLTVTLQPGETFYAEPGALLSADEGIELQSETKGGLGRFFSGERIFIVLWKNTGKKAAKVLFAAPSPGRLVPHHVKGSKLLLQRSAFLAATPEVTTSAVFTKKLGAGFFGGKGLILQELGGSGTAWFHAGGKVLERNLKKGEVLRVVSDHLVGFHDTVDFDIKVVPGIGNILFGGIGLFWAKLTGPGRVYLQTMPVAQLALALAPYMPRPDPNYAELLFNPEDEEDPLRDAGLRSRRRLRKLLR